MKEKWGIFFRYKNLREIINNWPVLEKILTENPQVEGKSYKQEWKPQKRVIVGKYKML